MGKKVDLIEKDGLHNPYRRVKILKNSRVIYVLFDEKDKGYLWDIEDACKNIMDFIKNTTHHEFINDNMKRFAVERQLLVIGEAANHLSINCIELNSSIPWKLIIALRNIISHEYGEILVDGIYKISKENVSKLKNNVSKLLKE